MFSAAIRSRKLLTNSVEMDYVFATTDQVEVWKGLRHRLTERPNKVGAILCNLSKLDKMPATLRHGGILVMPKLSAYVHNFGFALSEKGHVLETLIVHCSSAEIW